MNFSIDFVSIIKNPTDRIAAERIVLRCGIRADLKGFGYLVEAVMLYGNGVVGFNDIYRKVGAAHGLGQKSVMREIAYAVNDAVDIDSKLYSLTGKRYDGSAIRNCVLIEELGSLYGASRIAASNYDTVKSLIR